MTKVVFFGTGPVAAESLELLSDSFDIEAVITKPRPAKHKGEFPVLDVAKKHNYKTILVTDKANLDTVVETHSFKSQVAILIDFGIIVSQKVIDAFELGIINSHFSILPEWRGADPISFAILSGQKETGVSLMRLVKKMDEGPLLAFGVYQLPPDITTPLLTEHLIHFSAEMLKKEVPLYLKGKEPSPQSVTGRKASYSRKLSKKDSILDWNKPADQLEREIRAYSGWPGSKTTLADKEVTITAAHAVPSTSPEAKPGEITVIPEVNELGITTTSGTLYIDRLKPAGKKEMTTEEFIRGYGSRL